MLLGSWCQRFFGDLRPSEFGVLMYHRVTPITAEFGGSPLNVTTQRFREQLTGLLNRGFTPWSLPRLLAAHEAGEKIPARTFAVTFDDCFECVFTDAFPILVELKIPATLFLATSFLDSQSPFPFDDWRHSGEAPTPMWRPLQTSQCVEMQDSEIIDLGSHTHTHIDFRGQPEKLLADIQQSVDVLKSKFGVEQPLFAFPYGTKRVGFAGPIFTQAAKKAGVACALTTEADTIGPGSDPFDWGRFQVDQEYTAAALAGKLTGWFSYFRSLSPSNKRGVK